MIEMLAQRTSWNWRGLEFFRALPLLDVNPYLRCAAWEDIHLFCIWISAFKRLHIKHCLPFQCYMAVLELVCSESSVKLNYSNISSSSGMLPKKTAQILWCHNWFRWFWPPYIFSLWDINATLGLFPSRDRWYGMIWWVLGFNVRA